METIKMFKLSNDDIIITYVENVGEDYFLREPFVVYLMTNERTGRQSISIDHWLPVAVMESNEAVIKEKDIFAKMIPSSAFLEYYENAVMESLERRKKDRFNETVDESLTDDEMKLILDTINPPGSKYIN
jgi:hypothetical protein